LPEIESTKKIKEDIPPSP